MAVDRCWKLGGRCCHWRCHPPCQLVGLGRSYTGQDDVLNGSVAQVVIRNLGNNCVWGWLDGFMQLLTGAHW